MKNIKIMLVLIFSGTMQAIEQRKLMESLEIFNKTLEQLNEQTKQRIQEIEASNNPDLKYLAVVSTLFLTAGTGYVIYNEIFKKKELNGWIGSSADFSLGSENDKQIIKNLGLTTKEDDLIANFGEETQDFFWHTYKFPIKIPLSVLVKAVKENYYNPQKKYTIKLQQRRWYFRHFFMLI